MERLILALVCLCCAAAEENWKRLEWSYTTTDKTPTLLTQKTKLFQLSISDVAIISESVVTADWSTHDNTKSWSREKASEYKLKAEFAKLLEASAKLRFESLHSTEYRSMYSAHTISASKYRASWTSSDRMAKMTADARTILETSAPLEVFNQLGLFFCVDMTLGGLFSAEFVTEVSESDTSVEVGASVKQKFSKWVPKTKVGAKLEKSIESRASASVLKETTQILALGGQPEIWLKMTGPEDLNKVQAEWAESVDDSNLMLLSGTFAPLWDLLPANSSRRQELQTFALTNYALKGVMPLPYKPYCNNQEHRLSKIQCFYMQSAECSAPGGAVLFNRKKCKGEQCPALSNANAQGCSASLACYSEALTFEDDEDGRVLMYDRFSIQPDQAVNNSYQLTGIKMSDGSYLDDVLTCFETRKEERKCGAASDLADSKKSSSLKKDAADWVSWYKSNPTFCMQWNDTAKLEIKHLGHAHRAPALAGSIAIFWITVGFIGKQQN